MSLLQWIYFSVIKLRLFQLVSCLWYVQVVTFWEGEIVDNKNYTFFTGKWEAMYDFFFHLLAVIKFFHEVMWIRGNCKKQLHFLLNSWFQNHPFMGPSSFVGERMIFGIGQSSRLSHLFWWVFHTPNVLASSSLCQLWPMSTHSHVRATLKLMVGNPWTLAVPSTSLW